MDSKKIINAVVLAQGIENPVAPKFATPTGLESLIATLWKTAFLFAGLLTLTYLVLGGITWLTASGDKANSERAKSMITDAIIGLAIMAASFAIIKFLEEILGLSILQPKIPTVPFE